MTTHSPNGLRCSLLLGLAVLCVISGGVGCKRQRAPGPGASASGSASAAPAASARAPAFDPTPRVALLDAGQAPRTVLKVELEEGVRQQVRFRGSSKATQEVEGKQRDVSPPGNEYALDATVAEVAPGGAFVVVAVELLGSVGTDPKVQAALEQSVMRVFVTPNGTIRQAGAKGPVMQDPQAQQVLRKASSSLVIDALPFPSEPVGKGAKWQVTRLNPEAILVEQQAEVELLERSDKSVKLKVTGKLAAKRQPIRIPGARMNLEKFDGTLNGEWTVPLDRPLFHGSIIADSRQSAVAMHGDQRRKVVTHTVSTRAYEDQGSDAGQTTKPAPSASPPAGARN